MPAEAAGTPPVAIVERIDEFLVDAGILFRLDEVRSTGVMPITTGGAGGLCPLRDGVALIAGRHIVDLDRGYLR